MKYKVVIVNYGKTSSILRLLDQLSRQTLLPSSVCIVDNSPTPMAVPTEVGREARSFPIEIQYTPQNIGYSRACNLGASLGHWEWVALVNPDIEIDSVDFFADLIAKCRDMPKLGCAGVAQCNPDGSYELVARRFPTIRGILGKRVPWLGRRLLKESVEAYLGGYPNQFDSVAAPFPVEWLQSSFLLVPKHAWQACGGLSERYFVFMADTDFGQHCRKQGLDCLFFPAFAIRADGIRSSHGGLKDIFCKRTIRIHLLDAARYFLGSCR